MHCSHIETTHTGDSKIREIKLQILAGIDIAELDLAMAFNSCVIHQFAKTVP